MLRLCVAALLLASCWRGAASPTAEPEPFVARVYALGELRRATDALPPRLDIVEQRILGLVNETDRDAVRQDLAEIAQDIVTLRSYASSLRREGADPVVLDAVTHKLARVAEALAELREELVYARTFDEQHALDEQSHGDDDTANRVLRHRRVIVHPASEPDTTDPLEPTVQIQPVPLRPLVRFIPQRRGETP